MSDLVLILSAKAQACGRTRLPVRAPLPPKTPATVHIHSGVGKTLSARAYAGATEWEQWQRTGETNTEPSLPAA
ncbi:hypothetical protein [Arthrobacter sp. NPDC057009]|uniref:hypothetical protein n=1 Tax=Arthrobacter sp. NPDC057009 TaxID=3345996 RepID=UPI0036415349